MKSYYVNKNAQAKFITRIANIFFFNGRLGDAKPARRNAILNNQLLFVMQQPNFKKIL